jgi:hypothetical protein
MEMSYASVAQRYDYIRKELLDRSLQRIERASRSIRKQMIEPLHLSERMAVYRANSRDTAPEFQKAGCDSRSQ